MNTENLFIIFPPGAGGNHLANIIALSGRFQRSIDYSGYDNIKGHAHFSKIQNLEMTCKEIQSISTQNNVLCSHLAQYLWQQDCIKEYLPNRKYIIVDVYNVDTVVRGRMNKMFFPYKSNYMWEESSTLYSSKYFGLLTGETDYFHINVGMIATSNIMPLLTYLKKDIGLTIDQGIATEIHQKWYNHNFIGALNNE